MQYTEIFFRSKNSKNFDIFLIFAQNIDCGYMLESRGGSNEHPQCMFWIKYKKRYTPANAIFSSPEPKAHKVSL